MRRLFLLARNSKLGTRNLILLMFFLAVIVGSISWAGERGLPAPGPRDKCPVCGMFVARYPDFIAGIVFRDGSQVFFDGVKDLFKYRLNMERYERNRSAADIAHIFVTEYYELRPIDGRKAWYVKGSNIYGPMGRELIPFEREADAKEFMRDHKGDAVLRFIDIKMDMLKALD